MQTQMRRRQFAKLFGAAAVAWPFEVNAQSTGRIRRIGWLDYNSSAENIGTFVQAMSERGWTQGRTFRIEYRGGEGNVERLFGAAEELVRLPADLIVAPGVLETLAARRATDSIPIVVAGVDDPVGRGFVSSLSRPGGNLTGVASSRGEIVGKLLSLLREFFPQHASAAVLCDSTDPEHQGMLDHLKAAGQALGMSLDAVLVRQYTEVEPSFAAFEQRQNRMIVVPLSTMLVPRWIADLSLRHGLALASTSAGYAYEGGLLAYTEDWNAVFDRVAVRVDRILKGAKPADLPLELPTIFRLIVNATTARTLGVGIPPSIASRADYIIE